MTCEFCQYSDVVVGVICYEGTVDEIIVAQDEDTVYRKVGEYLGLPDGVTVDDWFIARDASLGNAGWYSPDTLRCIGIDPNEPVSPKWYKSAYEDSTIQTVEIIRKED